MAKIVKGARFISKISNSTGIIPTIPSNEDHTTGWKDTDIYVGEWFFNTSDSKIFFRTQDGIHQIITENNGKIDTDYLPGNYMGAMVYQGTWNPQVDVRPGISKPQPENGDYYIVSASGNTNLNGGNVYVDYNVGDFVVFTTTGMGWQKIDNSEPIINSINVLYSNTQISGMTNSVVSNALNKIFNDKFLVPYFDKTVNINKENDTSINSLLKLNGNTISGLTILDINGNLTNKWIGYNGTTLNIGSYDGNSIVQFGPKGLINLSLTSTANFNYTDTNLIQYNRWSIFSSSSNGYIKGFANDGITEKVLISTTGNTFFNGGSVSIGTTSIISGSTLQVNTGDTISKLVISRSGSNVGTGTTIGILSFYQNVSNTPTEYGNINLRTTSDASNNTTMGFKINTSSATLTEVLTLVGKYIGSPKVGINNLNPLYELDVVGSAKISTSLYVNSDISITGNTVYVGQNGSINFLGNNNTSISFQDKMKIKWMSTNDLKFYGEGGSTWLTLNSTTGLLTLGGQIKTPTSATTIYNMNQDVRTDSNVSFNRVNLIEKITYVDSGMTFTLNTDVPNKKYIDDQINSHANFGIWTTGFTNTTDVDVVLYSPGTTYYAGINIFNPSYNLHVVGNANITTDLIVGGNLYFGNIVSLLNNTNSLVFNDTYNTGKTLSDLSELTKYFTLSKTISKGKVVQLNNNNQIEDVHLIQTSEVINIINDELIFNDSITNNSNVLYFPNDANKFLICYVSNDISYIKVGTVIGKTIEYGIPIQTGDYFYKNIIFVPNSNNFIVTYCGNDDTRSYMKSFNIVGNTILNSGNEIIIDNYSTFTNQMNISFDPNNTNKFILSYYSTDTVEHIISIYTINNNTITFVNSYVYPNTNIYYTNVYYVNSTTFVLVYDNGTNGIMRLGNINTNTITFSGAEIIISATSLTIEYSSVIFLPSVSDKLHISFNTKDENDIYYIFLNGYNISGNTLSIHYMTEITSSNDPYSNISLMYYNDLNKVILSYYNTTDGIIFLNKYNYNGTTMVNTNSYTYDNVVSNTSLSMDNIRKGDFILSYNNDTFNGKLIYGNVYTNLNRDNIIGILQENGIINNIKSVRLLGGVDNNQTSLTLNKSYYLHDDGTLNTISSGNTVYIGESLSTTSIKINLNTNLENNLLSEEYNRTDMDILLSTSLSTEILTRISVDTSLSTIISANNSSRINEDSSLNNKITNETNARILSDNNINFNILTETQNRTNGDSSLSTSISTEIVGRTSGDSSLSSALSTEISNRTIAISSRISVDSSLSSAILTEISSRTNVDNSLSSSISSEVSGRISIDGVLTGNINNLTSVVSTEVSNRISGDSSLSSAVSTEVSNRISGDTSTINNIGMSFLAGAKNSGGGFTSDEGWRNPTKSAKVIIGGSGQEYIITLKSLTNTTINMDYTTHYCSIMQDNVYIVLKKCWFESGYLHLVFCDIVQDNNTNHNNVTATFCVQIFELNNVVPSPTI